MTEYAILGANSIIRLQQQVAYAMATGWKLAGGVSVISDPTDRLNPMMFYQAVTAEDRLDGKLETPCGP